MNESERNIGEEKTFPGTFSRIKILPELFRTKILPSVVAHSIRPFGSKSILEKTGLDRSVLQFISPPGVML